MGDDGLTGGHILLLDRGVCSCDRQRAVSPFLISPASVKVAILLVLDVDLLNTFIVHGWYGRDTTLEIARDNGPDEMFAGEVLDR